MFTVWLLGSVSGSHDSKELPKEGIPGEMPVRSELPMAQRE